MKILCTADWHFSINEDLDAELERSIRQMLPLAETCDLIAIPGDLFDARSSAASRLRVASLLQEFAERAPVVICRGNHDQEGELPLLPKLKAQHSVSVYEIPGVIYHGDVALLIMPWIDKGHAVGMREGMSMSESDATVSNLALQYLRNQIALCCKGLKPVLISHVMIKGARLQNNQPFIGEAVMLGQQDMKEIGLYGALMGHIHKAQDFDSMYVYPGSPVALNFGEDPDKRFCVMDTDAGSVEWHQLRTVDRYSMEFEWKDGRLVESGTYEPARIKGSRVRILLKVAEGEDMGVAKSTAEKYLLEWGALEGKVEPQVVPKTLVRSVEISKAEKLADKLDAYWKANDNYPLPEDQQGMKMKLAELEAHP